MPVTATAATNTAMLIANSMRVLALIKKMVAHYPELRASQILHPTMIPIAIIF